MKIAYIDCIAGASGDMLLGALVDAGLPFETLQAQLARLNLPGFTLTCRRVDKLGFSATKIDVQVADDVPARHLPEIEALVRQSDLPPHIIEVAVTQFYRLGEVEAGIHGTSLDHVHLHELGGIDTIVDVVGVLLGLETLGIQQVIVSPLPLGRGFVKGAHGQIPLPAPATLALLKGVPITGSDIEKELVTPTGAVLLTGLAADFGPIPAMTLEAIGYGAGGRDLPIPNLVRVLIGEQATRGTAAQETLSVLETNIDDLNPEFYEHVMARLFAAGALDVFMSPLQMKKNRPATLLRVLCAPQQAQTLMTILFAETSTLGVRELAITRHRLAREIRQVDTAFGPVRVKIATLVGGQRKAAPEYEDCRQLAESAAVPLRDVYRAAEQAAETVLNNP